MTRRAHDRHVLLTVNEFRPRVLLENVVGSRLATFRSERVLLPWDYSETRVLLARTFVGSASEQAHLLLASQIARVAHVQTPSVAGSGRVPVFVSSFFRHRLDTVRKLVKEQLTQGRVGR